MSAKTIAKVFRVAGFKVGEIQEGDDLQDGMVMLSKSVHVQVPTFGGACNVVHETTDHRFRFFPSRRQISDLIDDARAALKLKGDAK